MTTLTDAEIAEGQRLLAARNEAVYERNADTHEIAQAIIRCSAWLVDNAEALLTGYTELQARVKELERDWVRLDSN